MTVADVDGVKIAGLLFDAGTTNSNALLQVGPTGAPAEPRRQPDLDPGRVLPDRRRRRRQGDQQPGGQQQQHASSTTSGPGAPTTAAGVGWTVNTADTGLIVNGNNVTGVRPVRRALPEVRRDLERQRRPDHLLPERDAVRPAEPGRLARTATNGYAAYKVADTVTTPRGVGPGQLLQLHRRPGDRRRPRLRGADQRQRQVPRPADRVARRRGRHRPRHQQHRRPGPGHARRYR